jgi:hypothetical protein
MAIDKVLSSSIANGAVTAALISNTANLVVSSLTANVITITTISGSANVTGDMTVGGNLTISGTTTYVNTTDLNIGDAIISLNADLAANVSPTEDAGISINRGASTNAQFKWIESTDNWSLGNTSIGGTLTTTSNTVTLGTAAYVVANGNVGIGTSSPARKLEVSTSGDTLFRVTGGDANARGVEFYDSSFNGSQIYSVGSDIRFFTTATGSSSQRMIIDSSGNLGIGTASPGARLDVLGNAQIGSGTSGKITFNGAAGTGACYIETLGGGSGNPSWDWGTYSATTAMTLGYTISGTRTERIRIDSSGNLGVGTSSPNTRLDIRSASSVSDSTRYNIFVADTTAYATGVGGGINFGYVYDSSGNIMLRGTNIKGIKENSTDGNYASALAFSTTQNGASTAERMRIDSSGNTGIGTTTPTQKLDVNGTINANGIQTSGNASLVFGASKWMVQQETANQSFMYYCGANSSTYGTHYLYRATSTGSPLITMTYAANGNIGVGNTVPATKLHVFQRSDAGAAPNTPEIRIEHQDINAISTGGSNGGILSFVNIQRDATAWANNSIWGRINFNPSQPTSGTAQLGASILAAADGDLFGLQSASYLAFYTSDYTNGGNTGEKMRISAGGSVGIGSTAPANKLDVRGILGIGTAGTSSLNSFTIESVNTSAQNHTHTFSGPSAGTNDVLGFYLNRGGGSYGEFFVSFNGTYRFFVPGSTLNNNGDAYIMPPRYLGIGTTSPSYILDVNGMARVTGLQNNSLYSYTMIGTYTGGTWYTITDGGTMAQPGVYICTAYVDNYNLGGAVYYYTFASVPFYWGGNTIGSNGATAQVLPTMYGTGHALNSQTPPSLRINERYSSQTLQLQFSFQSTFTFDGTGGRNLSFSFTKIA